MKKRKGHYLLSENEFVLLQTIVERYTDICEYIRQKLLNRELLSTQQIVEKYCISRQTLYRLQKAGMLSPVIKHRCYYFDAEEVRVFFMKYWGKSGEDGFV